MPERAQRGSGRTTNTNTRYCAAKLHFRRWKEVLLSHPGCLVPVGKFICATFFLDFRESGQMFG